MADSSDEIENSKSCDKNMQDHNIEEKSESNTTENNQSGFDSKNIEYEGDVAIYTDPASGYQYQWDKDKEEWVAKDSNAYGFEDDTYTYTDSEGAKYFWDRDKSAWFPKIDDDFMAVYQLNYGFNQIGKDENNEPKLEFKDVQVIPKIEEPEEQNKKRKMQAEPSWFDVDDKHNTSVYVSNLPTDISEQEYVDLMQKCGLVMRDPITTKMKIKLYCDPSTNQLKGDGRCTYIRVESVDLALQLLDGSDYNGKKIKVERAKFQMKGTYDPKLKPKTRKKKDKQKLKRMQDKLFDWRPEKMRGERSKHEKVVIVKNLFEPSMFDENVGLILEFQEDLREECSKYGETRKIIIFDRHPQGVVQINMKTPEEADEVVLRLNDRWFGKRKITAEKWDGKTKYKIAETDAQISERMDGWDKFLEGEPTKQDNTTL